VASEVRVAHSIRSLIASAAALLLLSASAASQAPAKGDVRAEIARRLEISVEDVRPSPVEGLYEVRSGAEVGYVSTDGRFYVDGDVFEMQSKKNLTEASRQQGRRALLAQVDDKDAIIFGPAGTPRRSLTVFTDVDCAYCRRLHQEIGELNRLGIRVRYVFYPRGGPGTESWKKAEAVWCSADRKDALTRAKRGETLKAAGNCATPVAAQYALGRQLGIQGTPGIFTEQGEYLAGYLPAAQLAAYLELPATAAGSN
jgi:thiol:disulfide interchange protein DsbC